MSVTSIFAAVGQFPQDEAVLARATEIAAIHDAALTIVHIIDLPRDEPLPARVDTLEGQAEIAARDRIDGALRRLGTDPVDADVLIASGAPGPRLIEICNELEPDLVVMRAHQRTGIAETILGSTTERMIAAGGRPVLVVKRRAKAPYGRVLVATDGKDDAQGALYFITGLLPDARRHLVQAVEIAPQLEEAMLRSGTDRTGLRAHRNTLARNARNRLRAMSSVARGRVRAHVLRGDPATALSRATRLARIDLVVVGPGRSSLLRRMFVGSVTRRLLRDAACDVLVCRTAKPQR